MVATAVLIPFPGQFMGSVQVELQFIASKCPELCLVAAWMNWVSAHHLGVPVRLLSWVAGLGCRGVTQNTRS